MPGCRWGALYTGFHIERASPSWLLALLLARLVSPKGDFPGCELRRGVSVPLAPESPPLPPILPVPDGALAEAPGDPKGLGSGGFPPRRPNLPGDSAPEGVPEPDGVRRITTGGTGKPSTACSAAPTAAPMDNRKRLCCTSVGTGMWVGGCNNRSDHALLAALARDPPLARETTLAALLPEVQLSLLSSCCCDCGHPPLGPPPLLCNSAIPPMPVGCVELQALLTRTLVIAWDPALWVLPGKGDPNPKSGSAPPCPSACPPSRGLRMLMCEALVMLVMLGTGRL